MANNNATGPAVTQPTMNHAPERYRAAGGETLRIKTWGDETVVYSSVSGETHVLERHAGAILAELATTTLTIDEIRTLLTHSIDDYQPDMDDELSTYMEQLLNDFLALELIVAVD